VTGASRGIGAATARALAEKGWPVGVSFRSDSGGAEALVAELEGREMVALPVRGDISDPADVESVFSTLESRFGRVLVLVNNAGIRADGLCAQIDDEDWDRVLKTNLSAPFLTTRRALRRMIQAPLRPYSQHRIDCRSDCEPRAVELRRGEGWTGRVHEDGRG